jgi:hypothetical protein
MFGSWRVASADGEQLLVVVDKLRLEPSSKQALDELHLSLGKLDIESFDADDYATFASEINIRYIAIPQKLTIFRRKDGRYCLVVTMQSADWSKRQAELNLRGIPANYLPHVTLAVGGLEMLKALPLQPDEEKEAAELLQSRSCQDSDDAILQFYNSANWTTKTALPAKIVFDRERWEKYVSGSR